MEIRMFSTVIDGPVFGQLFKMLDQSAINLSKLKFRKPHRTRGKRSDG